MNYARENTAKMRLPGNSRELGIVAWHVWEELASQGAIVKPRDPATSTEGTYLVVES